MTYISAARSVPRVHNSHVAQNIVKNKHWKVMFRVLAVPETVIVINFHANIAHCVSHLQSGTRAEKPTTIISTISTSKSMQLLPHKSIHRHGQIPVKYTFTGIFFIMLTHNNFSCKIFWLRRPILHVSQSLCNQIIMTLFESRF